MFNSFAAKVLNREVTADCQHGCFAAKGHAFHKFESFIEIRQKEMILEKKKNMFHDIVN